MPENRGKDGIGQGGVAQPRPNGVARRAIVHIGTAKTGSTSIQKLLASNRDRLRQAGFLVPLSPGDRNHFRLAIYAGRERGDRMARATGEAGDAAYVADRFAQEFVAEMQAMPAAVHTVLFSNEHCYRKLDTPLALHRLRDLLTPWFSEIRILVYLRRQDEMATSLYSTRLRSGDDQLNVLPDLERLPRHAEKLDWHAMLERWASVFGRDAVHPRRFARDGFVEGDLLSDYVAAVGIDGIAALERPMMQNSAIVAPAQEFLRRVNTALDDGGDEQDEKAPPFVRGFVDQHFAGRGRRPSRAQAAAFMTHFAASNEKLRAAWFAERPHVFDDDFSRYPEQPDPLPSDGEVLDVALALIARQATDRPQEEAEALYRRAVKLLAAEQPGEARAMLNKALARRPGHAPSLTLLFELASNPVFRREAEARLRRARREEPAREDLARVQVSVGMTYDPKPPVAPASQDAAKNGASVPGAGHATRSPAERRLARQGERAASRPAVDAKPGKPNPA